MAKIDLRKTNITIVGQWNVAILSPKWIQSQFPEFKSTDDIPMEIGINIRDIRFTIKDIIVNPSPNRLVVSPKVETNDCYETLIALVSGIVSELEHTPIIAVGSNFSYVLDKSEDIKPVSGDSERLDEYYKSIGKKFSGSFISQHVLVEKDRQITVHYDISPNAKIVSFNYHQNTENHERINNFIQDFINQQHDSSKMLSNLIGN